MRAASRPPQLADSSAAAIVAAAATARWTGSSRQMRSPGRSPVANMVLSTVAAPWNTAPPRTQAEQGDQHGLGDREGDQGAGRQADQPQEGEVAPLALDMAAQPGRQRDQVAEAAAAGDQPEGDAEIAVERLHLGDVGRGGADRDVLASERLLQPGHVVDRAGIEAEPGEAALGLRPRRPGPAAVVDGVAVPPVLGGDQQVERRQHRLARRHRLVGDAGDGERDALRLQHAVALAGDLGDQPAALGDAEGLGQPAGQHDRGAGGGLGRAEHRVARPGRQQRRAGQGAAAGLAAQPGDAGGDRPGRRGDEGDIRPGGELGEEGVGEVAAAGGGDLAVAGILDQALGQGVDQAEAQPEQDEKGRQDGGQAQHLAQGDAPVMAEIPGGEARRHGNASGHRLRSRNRRAPRRPRGAGHGR